MKRGFGSGYKLHGSRTYRTVPYQGSESKTCLIDQLTVHDHGSEEGEESLGVENTIWAGAVVASGTATGISYKPGNS
jgi:hypothetical protein